VPQSNATGAADEPVLAHLRSGPASGVAGDRGDGLGDEPRGTEREEAERPPGRQAGSFTRSGKEDKPAIPGHGKGRLVRFYGISGSLIEGNV